MTADATTSAMGFAAALRSASAAWPDEFWTGSVGWADSLLRSYYGIYEFSDDPGCVLRVGLDQARAPTLLADGTRIEAGELVGTLHFWNEHLPRYSAKGPDLAWACAVRDRVTSSLRALSEYVEREPNWRTVRAVRAETFLVRLHALGECFVLWGLTRAFNPAALPRQPFLRDRHELWISRATLLARYAAHRTRAAAGKRAVAGAECPF
jgi:hypothetical protein